MRGEIADTTWKWEFGYLFDQTDQFEVASGGLEMSKMNALLGITDDPSAWNPFGYTPIGGRSTVNNVSTLSDQGTYQWLTRVQGLDFNSSGEVADLPGGAVKIALGFAERREAFDQAPDLAIKQGLISPYTVISAYSAVRTIWGGYGELLVPVFGKDFRIPAFAELTLSTALRYEDYSDVGDTGVLPRLSGRWKPLESESFAVRGSYAEGFSAPLFQQLYEPPSVSFFEIYDPYTGGTSRPQKGVLSTGNPNLKPTESTTWLVGGEYAPKFIKSLTLGMDYYRIEQSGIPYSSINYSVDQWYRAGGNSNPNNPWGPTALPSSRNPAGTQVEYDDARQQFVQIRNQAPINAGDRFTDGLDFQVAEAMETGIGMFTFSGLATYVLSFEQQDVAGAPMIDYLGRYWDFHAALPDTGYPEWRANATVAYTYKRLHAAFGFNYTAGYLETYKNADRSVDPYITFDLRAGYRIPHLEADLLVGVNNLLDADPPTVYNSFENSFDRAIGDPRGRMVFVSLSKTF